MLPSGYSKSSAWLVYLIFTVLYLLTYRRSRTISPNGAENPWKLDRPVVITLLSFGEMTDDSRTSLVIHHTNVIFEHQRASDEALWQRNLVLASLTPGQV